MKVREASYLDIPLVLAMLQANSATNAVDFKVLDYPTTKIYVAGENRITSVIPVHGVAVLESLGHDPSATAEERTAAVYALLEEVERIARDSGIRELHFVSSDERINESAVKHLGFVKTTVYRKKL